MHTLTCPTVGYVANRYTDRRVRPPHYFASASRPTGNFESALAMHHLDAAFVGLCVVFFTLIIVA